MTDTYGMIDEKTFEANSMAISDAILSTVYQSNVSQPGIKNNTKNISRSMKMVWPSRLSL